MENFKYEMFVRSAFSYALKEDIERCGDPAELANTDSFNDDNIDSVKSAIGYCMSIFNKDILGIISNDYDEMERVENFVKNIIRANTLLDIYSTLEDYNNTVKDKYYNINDGVIKLK